MSYHTDYPINDNIYYCFPDNEDIKGVFLNVTYYSHDGRPALIFWDNGPYLDSFGRQGHAHQLVQLSRLSDGSYKLFPFDCRYRQKDCTYPIYEAFLGFFDRDQRDRIINLALHVEFNPRSTINDRVVWLRELLVSMRKEKLTPKEMFKDIVRDALLPERQDE